MLKPLVCFLLAALAPGLAGAAWADDAGQVVSFNGDCFVNSGGQRSALKIGDAVHPGDSVDVPEKSKLKLRMADGSVLGLGPGTRLTIDSYTVSSNREQRNVKLGLDAGLLHATVAKMTQASNFEVDTALAVAMTRSTDWLIEASPDRTWVAVVEGQISFAAHEKGAPPTGAVTVAAGNESEVDAPPPAAPAPPDPKGAKAKPAPPPPRRAAPSAVARATPEQFDQLIDRTSVSFGWCQCTADLTEIQAPCQTSVDGCKAACSNRIESFVPNARESCARYYGDATGSLGPAGAPPPR
jgi:hypothetical protein